MSSTLRGERHFCIMNHNSIDRESFLGYGKSLCTTSSSLERFDNYLALADPEHVEQHTRFSYTLGALNFKSKHIDLFKQGTRCCRMVRCNNSSSSFLPLISSCIAFYFSSYIYIQFFVIFSYVKYACYIRRNIYRLSYTEFLDPTML